MIKALLIAIAITVTIAGASPGIAKEQRGSNHSAQRALVESTTVIVPVEYNMQGDHQVWGWNMHVPGPK